MRPIPDVSPARKAKPNRAWKLLPKCCFFAGADEYETRKTTLYLNSTILGRIKCMVFELWLREKA
jgi:hypothetical protein